MSSSPKTLVPATRRFAPASRISAALARPTPPSTCTWTLRQQLAEAAHAAERLRHERLSRIPGVDTHAEDEVDKLTRDRDDVVRLGFRVERNACAEAELARLTDHAWQVVAGLEVHGDAVAARLGNLPKVLGRLDHQVAVERPHRTGGRSANRLEDDRPDRDRLDEMSVTHVELEDPRSGPQQAFELVTEAREIRRVDRRLDLRSAYPVVPAHPQILSAASVASVCNDRSTRHPLAETMPVFLAGHPALPLGLHLE